VRSGDGDILTESDLLRAFCHAAAVFMHVTQVPEGDLCAALSLHVQLALESLLCAEKTGEDAKCVVRRHLVSTA
jgi:hypothetical protein